MTIDMTNADPTLPMLPPELQGLFSAQIAEAVLKGIAAVIGNYMKFNIPVHAVHIGVTVALSDTFKMLPDDNMKLGHLKLVKEVLDRNVAYTIAPAADRKTLS